jgi:hypothetical protein
MFIQYALKPCSLGLREEHTGTQKYRVLGVFRDAAANECFVCSDIRVPHVVDGV